MDSPLAPPLDPTLTGWRDALTARGTAAATRRAYLADGAQFAAWATNARRGADLGPLPVGVDFGLLRRYAGYLATLGYARATTQRKLAAVRSLCRHWTRVGALPANPAAHLPTPRSRGRLPRVPTVRETGALLDAIDGADAEGLRDRALLELLYGAGLRVSEALGLSARDARTAADTGRIVIAGKGGRERVAVCGDPARRALGRYLAEGRPALRDPGRPDPAAAFLSARGLPLSAQVARRRLAAHAARAGLDGGLHPHALRHAYATHMLDGGADLRSIQRLLGHASLRTTQVYTHVTQPHLLATYARSHPRAT